MIIVSLSVSFGISIDELPMVLENYNVFGVESVDMSTPLMP